MPQYHQQVSYSMITPPKLIFRMKWTNFNASSGKAQASCGASCTKVKRGTTTCNASHASPHPKIQTLGQEEATDSTFMTSCAYSVSCTLLKKIAFVHRLFLLIPPPPLQEGVGHLPSQPGRIFRRFRKVNLTEAEGTTIHILFIQSIKENGRPKQAASSGSHSPTRNRTRSRKNLSDE